MTFAEFTDALDQAPAGTSVVYMAADSLESSPAKPTWEATGLTKQLGLLTMSANGGNVHNDDLIRDIRARDLPQWMVARVIDTDKPLAFSDKFAIISVWYDEGDDDNDAVLIVTIEEA